MVSPEMVSQTAPAKAILPSCALTSPSSASSSVPAFAAHREVVRRSVVW